MTRQRAFTLIELLIVVAIIAILAAIAVPNFLEAQVRAKVSRLKADMRSAATALGAYAVDENMFPFDRNYDGQAGINSYTGWYFNQVFRLSTPIAYLSTTELPDPFFTFDENTVLGAENQPATSFRYYNLGYGTTDPAGNWGDVVAPAIPENIRKVPTPGYILKSFGPAKRDNGAEWTAATGLDGVGALIAGADRIYNPTNGTVSEGDIVRIEGSSVRVE